MKRREYDEYHKYGLVRINATQYEKCSDKCCKSGGSVDWELSNPLTVDRKSGRQPAFGKEEDDE